jgi:membrane-bound lytic murein transglycosylase D
MERFFMRLKYSVIILFFALTTGLMTENGQLKPYDGNAPIFPDEYGELDSRESPVTAENEDRLLLTIEKARFIYFKGLSQIHKGDTAQAAKYLQEALDTLNTIASLPGAEENIEFTDLAQSIVEDFETFANGAQYLDENSSVVLVRSMIYKEIGEIPVTGGEEVDPYDEYVPGLPQMNDTFQIPLTQHTSVEKSIIFWQTKRPDFFLKCLERSSRWFPMMKRIAEEEDVPLEIIYLSLIESAMNPNAVSRARAVGLWQFIHSTGKLYGLNAEPNGWLDERRDPEKATRAAMRHLKDLYREFGDWHLAFAAYNCGPGCVSRAIRRTGKKNPNYWEVRDKLPRETRGYVPIYIATALIATNPEKYGFNTDSLNFQDEYKYDLYPVDSAVNLNALAKAANITLEELKDLNPELIKSSTPPGMTYNLKIPFGTKDVFAVNYASLTPEEKHPFISHTVRRGETLSRISSRYGVGIDDIVEVNTLRSRRSKLRIGQELVIPLTPVGNLNLAEKKEEAEKDEELADVTHRVIQGETLYSIARRYGVDVAELRSYNNLSYNEDGIHPGQELVIARKKVRKEAEPDFKELETPKVVKHEVRRGESLAQIADDYNVTIADIKNSNNLRRNKIYPGQVLKIETKAIPSGNSGSVANNKPASQDDSPIIHKVGRGETLSLIAARYGVTERQLRSWNPSTIRGTTVYYNTKLKVYPNDNYQGSTAAVDDDVNNAPVYYKIRKGDTLISIARKYGVTVSHLKSKNSSISARNLRVGQRIRIQ